MTFGYKHSQEKIYGDPLPEKCPKILKSFKHFRVFLQGDYLETFTEGLPIIPTVRDMTTKKLKQEAIQKENLANGELISYLRYEARFNQYIFVTQDSVEIILPEGFISKNFLFPINKQ